MKLKRAGIITKVAILALAVYAVISLISLNAQVAEARKVREETQAEVEKLTQSNAELEYEISHGDDPKTIEDIARDKLGLVMPGEKIFYDVSN
ncbi:MAG TPA: septum formation initiator family protein [Clostridiales bacterium]|nr:septum formation initiator family protein [Clostridiales bacterium]